MYQLSDFPQTDRGKICSEILREVAAKFKAQGIALPPMVLAVDDGANIWPVYNGTEAQANEILRHLCRDKFKKEVPPCRRKV